MEQKLTSPDGVTVVVTSPIDAVNLKARGYTEVEEKKQPAKSTKASK